ncbi:hypothetical protein Bca101_072322 [Brassica carinata]
MSRKPNAKAVVSSEASAKTHEVMFFKDVKFGPQEGELRFRLIHFWEARNAIKKVLIGIEMLLIDEQGTVIQGFIPSGRIDTYLPHMISSSIYRLTNFYGSMSKTVYRVAEPIVTITFSWTSVLSLFEDSSVRFPEDRFRFHGYEEFEAGCDLGGDLYDYVGHIKLVGEQALTDGLVLDEVEIASSRRILIHVQTHDGPVMKLYLWDKAATDFCKKFKAHGNTPSVILVTTVNPKRFGGALTLSSLSSSSVFLDLDVQPTRDYLTWLDSNSDVANRVNPDIVTKAETVTIGELFSYIKHEGSKVAWFECTATIDDVVHGCAWYYISCGGCKTKATKGPTTLMCKKCGKAEVAGSNDSVGDDHIVPVPQALIDTIGQTRKFVVKVSKHNLEGKTQALTVTKVLPLEATAPDGNLEENVIVPAVEETLQMGKRVDGPSSEHEDSVDEAVKRSFDRDESGEAKRTKCG